MFPVCTPERLTLQNRVRRLVEVCRFLASTAKCWGSRCCFRELWREDPQDKWSWQMLGPRADIPQREPASHKQQGSQLAQPNLLPSPSSLCLPHNWPINREARCWGKEYDFIRKVGRPRRWRTRVPKKPSYQGLDANFFYRTQRGRRWGSKVKRPYLWQISPGMASLGERMC